MGGKKAVEKSREWEKERRDKLNHGFNELCKLLPDYDPTITLSKMEILTMAAQYIRDLQVQNENIMKEGSDSLLNQEVERLKKRVAHLLIKTKDLVDALRSAGVPIPNYKSKKKATAKGKPKLEEKCKNQNDIPALKMKTLEGNTLTKSKEPPAKKVVKCGCDKLKSNAIKKPLKEVNPPVEPKKLEGSGSSTVPETSCSVSVSPSSSSTQTVIAGSIVTPTTNFLSSIVPGKLTSVSTFERSVLSNLGPGTLILADGRIVNVPPLLPQIVVKPQPAVIVMQNAKSKEKLLFPKRTEITKTTYANKAPIPAIEHFKYDSFPKKNKTKIKKKPLPHSLKPLKPKTLASKVPKVPTTEKSVAPTESVTSQNKRKVSLEVGSRPNKQRKADNEESKEVEKDTPEASKEIEAPSNEKLPEKINDDKIESPKQGSNTNYTIDALFSNNDEVKTQDSGSKEVEVESEKDQELPSNSKYSTETPNCHLLQGSTAIVPDDTACNPSGEMQTITPVVDNPSADSVLVEKEKCPDVVSEVDNQLQDSSEAPVNENKSDNAIQQASEEQLPDSNDQQMTCTLMSVPDDAKTDTANENTNMPIVESPKVEVLMNIQNTQEIVQNPGEQNNLGVMPLSPQQSNTVLPDFTETSVSEGSMHFNKVPQPDICPPTPDKSASIQQQNQVSDDKTNDKRPILDNPTERNTEVDCNSIPPSHKNKQVHEIFTDKPQLGRPAPVRNEDIPQTGNFRTMNDMHIPFANYRQSSIVSPERSVLCSTSLVESYVTSKSSISISKVVEANQFSLMPNSKDLINMDEATASVGKPDLERTLTSHYQDPYSEKEPEPPNHFALSSFVRSDPVDETTLRRSESDCNKPSESVFPSRSVDALMRQIPQDKELAPVPETMDYQMNKCFQRTPTSISGQDITPSQSISLTRPEPTFSCGHIPRMSNVVTESRIHQPQVETTDKCLPHPVHSNKSPEKYPLHTESAYKSDAMSSGEFLRHKDTERNIFMPIIDDVRLTSDFSNDLFSSLQVPSAGQHSESISPTAAFLLAFPLVSTSKNAESLPDEAHDNQTSTPTTILQIGNIEPPSSELFHPIDFNMSRSKINDPNHRELDRYNYDINGECVPSVSHLVDHQDKSYKKYYEKRKDSNMYQSVENYCKDQRRPCDPVDNRKCRTKTSQAPSICPPPSYSYPLFSNCNDYPIGNNPQYTSADPKTDSLNIMPWSTNINEPDYSYMQQKNNLNHSQKPKPVCERKTNKQDKNSTKVCNNYFTQNQFQLNECVTNKIDKKKTQKSHQHRISVNWMTTPDNRTSLPESEPQPNEVFSSHKGREVTSLTCAPPGQNVYPSNPANPLEVPLDSFQEICSSKRQSNCYSWSPSKSLLPSLDNHTIMMPSTLPTLVGDLALGTNTPMDSFRPLEKKNETKKPPEKEPLNDRTKKREDFTKAPVNNPTFLSVSQLVDPKCKKPKTDIKQTYAKRSLQSDKNLKQRPRYGYNSGRKDGDPNCMYSEDKTNYSFSNHWGDKQRNQYKGGSYSAESLIGVQQNINQDVNEGFPLTNFTGYQSQPSNYFQNTEFAHPIEPNPSSQQYQNCFNLGNQTHFSSYLPEEYPIEGFSFSHPNCRPNQAFDQNKGKPTGKCGEEATYQSGQTSSFLQPQVYSSFSKGNVSYSTSCPNPVSLSSQPINTNTTTTLTNFNLSTIFPEINDQRVGSSGHTTHLNPPFQQNYSSLQS